MKRTNTRIRCQHGSYINSCTLDIDTLTITQTPAGSWSLALQGSLDSLAITSTESAATALLEELRLAVNAGEPKFDVAAWIQANTLQPAKWLVDFNITVPHAVAWQSGDIEPGISLETLWGYPKDAMDSEVEALLHEAAAHCKQANTLEEAAETLCMNAEEMTTFLKFAERDGIPTWRVGFLEKRGDCPSFMVWYRTPHLANAIAALGPEPAVAAAQAKVLVMQEKHVRRDVFCGIAKNLWRGEHFTKIIQGCYEDAACGYNDRDARDTRYRIGAERLLRLAWALGLIGEDAIMEGLHKQGVRGRWLTSLRDKLLHDESSSSIEFN